MVRASKESWGRVKGRVLSRKIQKVVVGEGPASGGMPFRSLQF